MANRLRGVALLCLLIGLVATPAMAQQQDVRGSKDHPLISRYPGSFIKEYSQKDFDQFTLPLGKLTKGKFEKSQNLEGRVTRIHYQAPAGRSVLEVFSNYEAALKQGG